MSWDVFVQDLPLQARTIYEIPDDFRPMPIGKRSDIIARIKQIAPSANFDKPEWGVIDGQGFSIEVSLGAKEIVESFAFYIRGGNDSVPIITAILRDLGLRAIDPQSETGFFGSEEDATESLLRWRAYREQIISND